MLEKAVAVFLVLGLLIATLAVLRQKGLATLNLTLPKRSAANRRMQVIERISLTPHHSLHLVRVHDKVLLVGVSPSSCGQIDSFTDNFKETTSPEVRG